jgi:hypothetical protein
MPAAESPIHAWAPWAFAGALALIAGCDGGNPAAPVQVPDPGPWIVDSEYTIDEFPFDSAACAEVFPPGSISADSAPAGSAASLRIVTTACYALTVRVVGADSDTVRTFATRFAIFNRRDSDKNRGAPSYAAWDGKNDLGGPAPPGRYLWRMEFDFGFGRVRRFRADIQVR